MRLLLGHLFSEVTDSDTPFSVWYLSSAGSVHRVQLRSCLSQKPPGLPLLGLGGTLLFGKQQSQKSVWRDSFRKGLRGSDGGRSPEPKLLWSVLIEIRSFEIVKMVSKIEGKPVCRSLFKLPFIMGQPKLVSSFVSNRKPFHPSNSLENKKTIGRRAGVVWEKMIIFYFPLSFGM